MILSAAGCSRKSPNEPLSPGKKQIALVIVQDSALRLDPIVSSARIDVLGTGEKGEVIDFSKEKGAVGGKQDFWYKIRLHSGVTGWIWGQNIKVFAEGEDKSVESFAKDLRSAEEENVRKQVRGRWWSVIGEDTYTNFILSLKENGEYAALLKGTSKPVEGNYMIDTEKTLITFDKGTPFGNNVNYIIRGDFYILEAVGDKSKVRFKRISTDPNFKDEIEQEAPESDAAPEKKAEDAKAPQ
jgi:uncharacterized protein YgiM (DUF1202 family)